MNLDYEVPELGKKWYSKAGDRVKKTAVYLLEQHAQSMDKEIGERTQEEYVAMEKKYLKKAKIWFGATIFNAFLGLASIGKAMHYSISNHDLKHEMNVQAKQDLHEGTMHALMTLMYFPGYMALKNADKRNKCRQKRKKQEKKE